MDIIYDFDDFIGYATKKGYSDDFNILDFEEYYQNLLDNEANYNLMIKFINDN
ncbi:MAG: hypothetical protein M0R03_08630 [Novosphingobium sp.]|nr:hypothetical protein [Novosphingobium sp.]